MSWTAGNKKTGKHYWLTPPALMQELQQEFNFNYDPCPWPKPEGYDGLTAEWGTRSYCNPPFGAVISRGQRVGITAWARKCIDEYKKGKLVVFIVPIYKNWDLIFSEFLPGTYRSMGNVRWCATEDLTPGPGAGPTGMVILQPAIILPCVPDPIEQTTGSGPVQFSLF